MWPIQKQLWVDWGLCKHEACDSQSHLSNQPTCLAWMYLCRLDQIEQTILTLSRQAALRMLLVLPPIASLMLHAFCD